MSDLNKYYSSTVGKDERESYIMLLAEIEYKDHKGKNGTYIAPY